MPGPPGLAGRRGRRGTLDFSLPFPGAGASPLPTSGTERLLPFPAWKAPSLPPLPPWAVGPGRRDLETPRAGLPPQVPAAPLGPARTWAPPPGLPQTWFLGRGKKVWQPHSPPWGQAQPGTCPPWARAGALCGQTLLGPLDGTPLWESGFRDKGVLEAAGVGWGGVAQLEAKNRTDLSLLANS